MPAIFFGHGNPMNALLQNRFNDAWAVIGLSIPQPKAVLAVSAHWYAPHVAVSSSPAPRTIHDFTGFPPALYQVTYPAPGSPELARRIRDLLAPVSVALDDNRGIDHGTWSVLCHVLPEADIPVVQLSIDRTQPPAFHYALGKQLKPLREEGVLVVGSGNIVHNLEAYAWDSPDIRAFDWAVRFEDHIQDLLIKGKDGPIVDYTSFGRDALKAVPTPDHYLPLLYILGLRRKGDPVSFPVEGMDGGAVSMLAVRMG